VQFEAFLYWTDANLTPRVWAVCDDVRNHVQRSEDLVERSRALLRRHDEEKRRRSAFEDPYILRLSERPSDKLLAIVNRDLERAVGVLPEAYHQACSAWFNSLPIVDRITAEFAGRVYLTGHAATAERIAAELPQAPDFPFRPVVATPAAIPRRARSGYERPGRSANG
jgi:hypothetical protein